jgi:hypothetical protein
MSDIETLRAAMRAAQVFGKGQYFEPGRYRLRVAKLFYKESMMEGTAKKNIIAEFTVLESSNPDVEVGSTRSSVFAFHHKGWLPRFKAVLIALSGRDPDAKSSPEIEKMVEDIYVALLRDDERIKLGFPENFLAGVEVLAEAMPGTSMAGKPVTNMKWTPVPQS